MQQKLLMRPKEPDDRKFLYYGLKNFIDNYLKEYFIGAEIGSYSGESSIRFANKIKKLYCIDIWEENVNPVLEQPINEIELLFDERTKIFSNIEKIKKLSLNAINDFNDNSLDFVYIDACHDYSNCFSDISNWYSKIKTNGIISGHDYSGWDVFKAVNNFAVGINKSPVMVFEDSTWAFYK